MKRITSLLTLLTFASVFNTATAQDRPDVQDRPNILWVTSEDNSHYWIGCYGNEQASTPNIDQFAADGVRYRFAYANTPSRCAPRPDR